MDEDTRKLDLKQEYLSIKDGIEIKEEKIECFEGILSEGDSFNNGNISQELQSFDMKGEIMDDVTVKGDPYDYEKENGEEKLKDIRNFSVKQENAITDKNTETLMPSTSGINQKLKGERSDKRLSLNPSQAGKFEVSNTKNKCSEIKNFICSVCGYEMNRKDHLKRHLLNHSGAKMFKCSECSYKTNQKGHLKIHLLNHSGAKMFKCSECSYETNQKGNLKVHLLKHSGVKMFKCSKCSYETYRKDHLKRHLSSHYEMLKSSECNYERCQTSYQKAHLLKHFGAKMFKCSECCYETTRKDHLKRHILNQHTDRRK